MSELRTRCMTFDLQLRRSLLTGFKTSAHQLLSGFIYINFLENSREERLLLWDDLMIGVTSFFRDRESWQYLETKVLPKLISGLIDADNFVELYHVRMISDKKPILSRLRQISLLPTPYSLLPTPYLLIYKYLTGYGITQAGYRN